MGRPEDIEDRPGPCASPVDSVASAIFEFLAERFPVCTASDEFHFFPQVRPEAPGRYCWDDFSDRSVRQTAAFLEKKRSELYRLKAGGLTPDDQTDLRMLVRMISTLTEQLADAAPHRVQPSFYTTIIGIGLAEDFEKGPDALTSRLAGLPDFLDQARHNLRRIPRLFCRMGIEMIQGLRPWVESISPDQSVSGKALQALDRLADHLKRIPVTEAFLPPEGLYERIASDHMGCFAGIDEISDMLEAESAETRLIMEQTANRIDPGRSWQELLHTLPRPGVPGRGVTEGYRLVVSDLVEHCRSIGLVSPDFIKSCPVSVEPVPAYLLPVRSSAAYSIRPGHPPSGGTFFILETGDSPLLPQDYRLLAAHETLPGHHLLDARRWGHARPVRRHIEFPIFYEGWACFAEELLFDTGFFNTPPDRLLLAKRRFFRALRGRVDLDLHTGRKNLQEAAAFMSEQGLDKDQAQSMVRRYILKPGYQLAYAVGRCRFRNLYFQWIASGGDPVGFAQRVLSLGEIGFDQLKRVLFKEERRE